MFLPATFIGGLLLAFESGWAHLGFYISSHPISYMMAINNVPTNSITLMVVQKLPIICSVSDTVYSVKIGK